MLKRFIQWVKSVRRARLERQSKELEQSIREFEIDNSRCQGIMSSGNVTAAAYALGQISFNVRTIFFLRKRKERIDTLLGEM